MRVTGIDSDPAQIASARSGDNPANLEFLVGDALADLPEGPWDTIILSNILEHIDARVDFLRRLIDTLTPGQVLIRVPLFERDWRLPLRRELGMDYFSDPTHHIEHTLAEFESEAEAAGLVITERVTLWGEIWAACRPAREPDDA